jgi:hypothetical protein
MAISASPYSFNTNAYSQSMEQNPYLKGLQTKTGQSQFGTQGIADVIAAGTQKAYQNIQPGASQQAGQAAVDLLRKEQDAARQTVQDLSGKQGIAGTAKQIKLQAGIEGDLARSRQDARTQTEMAQEKSALDTALQLGGLGSQVAGQTSQAELGAAGILSQEQMQQQGISFDVWKQGRVEQLTREGWTQEQALQKSQQEWQSGEATLNRTSAEKMATQATTAQLDIAKMREMGETDRQNTLLSYQGSQEDLNRDLTREVEAGRISQQEADRMSQEFMQGRELDSRTAMQLAQFAQDKDILKLTQEFQGSQADLDRSLTREVEAGRMAQADADRISRERLAFAQITSTEKLSADDLASREKMAELDRALTSKVESDRNYLTQQGIDLDRARQEGYTDANGNYVMGELGLRGKELGLQGETLELQRQEVTAKITDMQQRLILAQQQQDLDSQRLTWDRVLSYAELLPPEQGAATLAMFAEKSKMDIPKQVTDAEGKTYLQAAGGDPDKAKELAWADGKIFVGDDGVTPYAPGENKDTALDGATASALGGRDVAFFDTALNDWVRPPVGSYVNFTKPVNAPELGYGSLPAGTYKVEEIQMPIYTSGGTLEKMVPVTVFSGSTGNFLAKKVGGLGTDPNRSFSEAGITYPKI